MKSQQIIDGKWVRLKGFTHQECCNCGLTHAIQYQIIDGEIWHRLTVDHRETARSLREKLKTR